MAHARLLNLQEFRCVRYRRRCIATLSIRKRKRRGKSGLRHCEGPHSLLKMGKRKQVKKFAAVKRMMNPNDQRL